MTTTALSALPSSLAALLSNYTTSGSQGPNDTADTAPQAAPTPPGGALGTDPAYTLKLGQQGSSKALIGYTRLATLGGTFEGTMNSLETPTAGSAMHSVSVEVHQLAQAQTLVSGAFGDSDHVSLGTGTLTINTGTLASDGSFAAKDGGTSIAINGGTLDDITASINAAKAGVTASVVEEGGGYALKLTGTTGADQAFSIQGLSELAYDPASPETSMLTESQTAQDAVYSVDGNDFVFGSNSKVPVAFGVTTDFTATGPLSVAKPPQADGMLSLVTAFNTIQQSIAKMADKDGDLANDANLAAGMFKTLGDAATGTYDTGGKFTSLSQLGVTVQPDGTLKADQTALSEAVANNPTDLQALISAVSQAMDNAMTPYLGSKGSIASLSNTLGAQIAQGGSLLDYLDGSTPGSGQKTLVDYLGGGSGSSSSPKSLMDYLGSGDSSTGSDSSQLSQLLAAG